MFGNIQSKGRPLRLAFIIKPNDKKALIQAIEINSVLWGGSYNPIIPFFKRKSKRWRKNTFGKTAKDITLGYIRAFDPDLIVCNFEVPKYIKDLGLKVIKNSEIMPSKEDPDLFSYGVGIWSLLDWIYKDHFKFIQRFPVHLSIPNIPLKNAPFWASLFGKLPEKIHKDLLSPRYKKAMDIKTPMSEISKKVLNSNSIFPRRITQHGLETHSRGGFSNENIVFFLDPADFLDVVDFWNLRAVGRSVLPVPNTLKDDEELKSLTKGYIESSQGTHRYNLALKYKANIIPSATNSLDDTRNFINSLNLDKDDDGDIPVSMHQSYPRIWDDWARGKDSIDPHNVYFDDKTSLDIRDGKSNNRIVLPISFPKDIEGSYYNNPRIVNEISFNVYSGVEKYAEVFPKIYGEKVAQTLDVIAGFGNWRIGRNGLVRLVSSFRSSGWELPLAEDIFSAWLDDNDWDYEPSTAGKLAKELYRQIEGWTYGLAKKEIIELIESMARSIDGEGRDKPIGFIKSRMKEITGSHQKMEKFLEMNFFNIGINTQCPNCQRSSWFELEKLKKQMTCPKCLSNFKAIDTVGSSKWSYKTVGPLSVPNHADGAISVIFAVNFFSGRLTRSIETTPVYSFNANKKGNNNKIEADFAFLWRESEWGEVAEGVAFGESKTFNEFKNRDFKRMKELGKEFPGSVIIFSTLREKLTDYEVKELRKFAKNGNRYWKSNRPINPVLILTGKELLSQFPPPYSWTEAEQKKYRNCRGILSLAKATQQKYLGIKPWDQVWYDDWEKKRKDKKIK